MPENAARWHFEETLAEFGVLDAISSPSLLLGAELITKNHAGLYGMQVPRLVAKACKWPTFLGRCALA